MTRLRITFFNSSNRLFLSILGLFAILFAGCSNVEIENSAGYTITVQVDEKQYEVEPYTFKGITLERGQHNLLIKDVTGRVIRDTVIDVEETGLITYPGNEYVLFTVLYGTPNDRSALLQEEWVEIHGSRYFGDFTIYNEKVPYIEKKWDYGVLEPFPDSKQLLAMKDFVIVSKLFHVDDFRVYYREQSGMD